jgi:hypothetical protein
VLEPGAGQGSPMRLGPPGSERTGLRSRPERTLSGAASQGRRVEIGSLARETQGRECGLFLLESTSELLVVRCRRTSWWLRGCWTRGREGKLLDLLAFGCEEEGTGQRGKGAGAGRRTAKKGLLKPKRGLR